MRLPLATALAAFCAFLAPEMARATIVEQYSLDKMLAKSATVVRGRVTATSAARETMGRGNPILTTVTIAPVRIYKGAADNPLRLKFLGGTVGELEMRVDGMPEFVEGGEYVFFISPESNRACPLVGWSAGSLRVSPGADAQRTVEVTGFAIHDFADLAPMDESAERVEIPLSAFESRLESRLTP